MAFRPGLQLHELRSDNSRRSDRRGCIVKDFHAGSDIHRYARFSVLESHLGDFPDFNAWLGLPYLYRIVNAQGETTYRTDIFSRGQAGRGALDPAVDDWPGTVETLDGRVSCSVVIDPDTVRRQFVSGTGDPRERMPAEEFWAFEFSAGRPIPSRIEDLVIVTESGHEVISHLSKELRAV